METDAEAIPGPPLTTETGMGVDNPDLGPTEARAGDKSMLKADPSYDLSVDWDAIQELFPVPSVDKYAFYTASATGYDQGQLAGFLEPTETVQGTLPIPARVAEWDFNVLDKDQPILQSADGPQNPEAASDDFKQVTSLLDAGYELDASLWGPQEPHFDFRTKCRQKDGPSTWIDNDETGNYDPKEENRQIRKERLRKEAAVRARLSNKQQRNNQREIEDKLSDGDADVSGKVTTLRFTSAAGKIDFSDLVSWQLPPNNDPKIDFTAKPWARGCYPCLIVGNPDKPICSIITTDERQWPCKFCEANGHECHLVRPPIQKQACETCKRRSVTCSHTYTRNHGAYCLQCYKIDQPCLAGPVTERIKPRICLDRDWKKNPLPPTNSGQGSPPQDCAECQQASAPCKYIFKEEWAACERCLSLKRPCTMPSALSLGPSHPVPSIEEPLPERLRKHHPQSAANEPDQGAFFEHADEKERNVGPGSRPVPPGEEPLPERLRKHHQQDAANKPDQDALFKHADAIGRNVSPESHPVPSIEESPPKRQKQHHHQPTTGQPEQDSLFVPAYTPEPSVHPTTPVAIPQRPSRAPNHQRVKVRPKGTIKVAFTNFSHPILLNCDRESLSCHFCLNPEHAIKGLGKVKVELVYYADGRGLEERRGGHRAQGVGNTQLCSSCTTNRMLILGCVGHRMREISEDKLKISRERRNDPLRPKRPDRIFLEDNVTAADVDGLCGVCTNGARFECITGSAGLIGCGLRLCFECDQELHKGGGLQGLLNNIVDDRSEERLLGLRADHELLKQSGPIQWAMQN